MSPRKAPSDRAIKDRNSTRYTRLAKRYRSKCEVVKAPCWICGQPIDYTIPPGNTDAFEVDHFHPVTTHPHLFEEPANFRPSHKGCNSSRGNKELSPTLGQPSEEW
ncbi:HNH endonuclease [Gordonia phage Upyo]|nr:HNH endonuclease [Gordonia phage Upyo]